MEIPNSVEGEDLSAVIREGKETERAALYMAVAPSISPKFIREYRATRTSRYTYARQLDGPWLWFDNDSDPYQLENFIGVAEHAALARDLDARLQAQLKSIGDDFRPARSYIEDWGCQVEPHGSVPDGDTNTKPQSPQRKPTAKPGK